MKRGYKRIAAALTGLAVMLACTQDCTTHSRNALAASANSIPAFPGAVGGGSLATGGRGGKVVHVTNLNDSGTGSFREAVGGSGKIVVFDVSGTIELKSDVVVGSDITIAGQTAPGGAGITLKNYKLGLGGTNVICRYISSRPGERGTSADYDAWGGANGTGSIIDHCSLGWANDEQWGLYSQCDNITVQYSVIGPSNSFSYHSKGIHGFGIMLGRSNVTYDHNLIVHNVSRNFRGKVTGTNTADFTNNVIYNWASQTAYGTLGHVNYVGNTLKKGVSTVGGHNYVSVGDSGTAPENYLIYLSGNRFLNRDNTQYSNFSDNNWAGIKYASDKNEYNTRSNSYFPMKVDGVDVSSVLSAESSANAYDHVISYAGNGISSDRRTEIDKQVAYETEHGTGTLTGARPYSEATDEQKATIDKYQMQCGVTYKYPAAVSRTITDTDNDGMPDEWEKARGLDPYDASDAYGDYCLKGYSNIEYYINDLTVNSFPEGVVELSPLEGIKTKSAFEKIEAEDFTDQSGVKTETNSEAGQNVGYIENGDYIRFSDIDFSNGAYSFTARLAGSKAGIELYLDSLDNTPVAVCDFAGSDGWQTWKDESFNISGITGVHDLYIRFTGAEGYLVNIDSFYFSKERVPLSATFIKNLTVYDTANAADWKITKDANDSSMVYGDRDVTFKGLPEFLTGSEMIATACDSKAYTDTVAEFTAGDSIDVYAGVDTRVTATPLWLEGWEKTDLTFLNSSDVEYAVFKKKYSKGDKITLGSNGQSAYCVNYCIFAVKSSDTVIGDVDQDGVLSVSDAVLLQKILLGMTSADSADADVNDDGIISLPDFIKLKNLILTQ
ncbi:MAG: carbohydrate-binding protein [Oscillospiraceae bacterium]|nr:carbohydrate-binding protein [Oscillospiraceae bacterium]